MWTFFRDQILSSLIGGVAEERFHCVRGFFCFIHSLISRTAVNQEEAVVWRKETSVDFPLPDKRKMSDWKLMTRAHWRANFTDFLHVYAPLVYFYFSLLPWGKILRGSFFAALFPFGWWRNLIGPRLGIPQSNAQALHAIDFLCKIFLCWENGLWSCVFRCLGFCTRWYFRQQGRRRWRNL